MPHTDIKVYGLLTLFLEIEKGIINIPAFQRDFVWNKNNTIDLLESIYKDFPIGTVYFLRSDHKLFNSSTFEYGVKKNESTHSREYIIIDGTQRLRALYYCLYIDDDNKPYDFHIGFDLKRGKFIHLNLKKKHKYIVKLTSIFSSEKFVDNLIALSKLEDSGALLKEMNNLYYIFKNYQFPVITVSDASFSDVVEIFQLLNTSGKSLSKTEIMKAMNQKQ